MKARITLADGREVEARLRFMHDHDAEKPWFAEGLRGGDGAFVHGATLATVITAEHEVLASAIANCSTSDNYNRETGRRLALKKLLKNAKHLPGPARQAIWECYQNRRPNGSPKA